MSFTIIDGLYEPPSSVKNVIQHEGASKFPVGTTQIGMTATWDAVQHPLPGAYSDYQTRTIDPNLVVDPHLDMRWLHRVIAPSSGTFTAQSDWGFFASVQEELVIDKITPFPEAGGYLDSKPGDINLYFAAAFINSSYTGSLFVDPTGSTSLFSTKGKNYPQSLAYEVITQPKQVRINPLQRTDLVENYWYFVITLRPPSAGKTFQIKHNGQLIPATPNLWSGGSLTPVNLNLPQ